MSHHIIRRTIIRRPVSSGHSPSPLGNLGNLAGNGNTTVIIIQNGPQGGGFRGGLPSITPGLRFGDGYPGSPGFNYGHILPSSTYSTGFGPGFGLGGYGGYGGYGYGRRGYFGPGLTGRRSLDGLLATGAGGVAANAFGGDPLGGTGGAGFGQIFGDGDPKKAAVIGGLAGAGIDFLRQGGANALFGKGGDPNNPDGGRFAGIDGGSIVSSGVSAALGGLFNL